MKRFDDIFRQQAEKSFSSYNADHLADAGWNAFARKQRRKDRAMVIPLWARAASVAILIAVGSVFTYRALDRKADQGMAEIVKSEAAAETLAETRPEITGRIPVEDTGLLAITETTRVIGVDSEIAVDRKMEDITVSAAINPAVSVETDSMKVGLTVKEEEKALKEIEVIPAEEVRVVITEPETIVTEPEVIIKRDRKMSVMAGFSGMMARAEEVTSGVPGVSVGIYTEHRITRRISVRHGLVLAKNTIGLENGSSAENRFGFTAPALDRVSGEIDSYEASMELLAMEVPLNFIFTIIDRQKSSLFVSAGASTMIYLSQNLSGSYCNVYSRESLNTTTGEASYETRYSTVEIEREQDPFSHTDYFGLANFSAGYSMPFGKKSNLLVEPFLQLPVHKLTSLNLKVKYGGVSMKIRFGK